MNSAPPRSARAPTPTRSATPSAAAGSTRPPTTVASPCTNSAPPSSGGRWRCWARWHVAGGLRVRRHGHGPAERPRPHRGLHDPCSTASAAATRVCTTCGYSATRRARRPVGLAVRRAPRVGVRTWSPTAPSSRPRRRSSAPTRRSPRCSPSLLRPLAGPEDIATRPDAVARHSPCRPRRCCCRRRPADIIGGNRTTLSEGDKVLSLVDIWRAPFDDPVQRGGAAGRSATPSTTSPTSPRTSTPSSRSPPPRKAFPPPSSTPSSGSSCGVLSPRTSTGCPRRSA